MRIVVLWFVLVGCTAETVIYDYAGEDSWSTPHQIPLQLRVSTFDKPNTITAVAQPASSAESPTGPADAGTTLPVTIDGVACEVAVLGRTSDTVTKSRPDTEVRRTTPAGSRTIRGLNVRISCGGQPIPGTDASHRGSRSRLWTPLAAVFLVLGLLTGWLFEKDKIGLMILVGAVTLIGGAVTGLLLFEGLFRITYALLFVGHGLAGTIAMRGDSPSFRVTSVAGAVIGTAIAPLLWPVWNAFGPICAILFGAGVAVIGIVAVTLKEG